VNLPPPENVPPGWYQDPNQPGQLRWWDGGAWGADVRPQVPPKDPRRTGRRRVLLGLAPFAVSIVSWIFGAVTTYVPQLGCESCPDGFGWFGVIVLMVFGIPGVVVLLQGITMLFMARGLDASRPDESRVGWIIGGSIGLLIVIYLFGTDPWTSLLWGPYIFPPAIIGLIIWLIVKPKSRR